MSFFISNSEPYPKATQVIRVIENFTEKPGLLLVEPSGKIAEIAVGKTKVLFGAAKDAIRKLHYYCLNYNKSVAIDRTLYEKYKNFFEEFPKSNIEIIHTP